MNGIIIINKHKGCTSHDIVYKVKKIFNEKVGHTGTLDPMATGVLPLLVGKGTLCSKYLINHDKTYKVKLQLGQKTDTADSEGKVIEEDLEFKIEENNDNNIDNYCNNTNNNTKTNCSQSKIKEILQTFIGKQEQIPPIYSAIKVKGKKLYEYARKGQTVEIQPRKIEIYDIELINIDNKLNQIEFRVKCSKGTYIRSLCEDIATKIGTVGYMKELEREQVGKFFLENSITVDELEKNKMDIKFIEEHFIELEKIFEDKDTIELDNRKLGLFLNGVKLTCNKPDGVYKIYFEEKFIGTGIIENNLLKRDIIK